ncbi:MAG TPA: FG-GAP-like repeat-containing protein [Acidisarcina sp.]
MNEISAFSRRTFLWAGGSFLVLHAARLRAATPAQPPPTTPPPCLLSSRASYPPALAKFIEKLDPALDVFPAEIYFEQIDRVLSSWSASLISSAHNLDLIERHLAEEIRASSFSASRTEPLRTHKPLLIERRHFDGPETRERSAFLSGLAGCLSPWPRLETVELQVYGIRIVAESPLMVETDIRYDLVGMGGDGWREQLVGAWHLSWIDTRAQTGVEPESSKGEQPRWIVQRWKCDSALHSKLLGPGFTEITGSCIAADSPGMAQLVPGIDDWRTALESATGIDVYGNHGLAVGDIDGSGYDSFYVCQPSGLPNRLFRNRGDGTFEDMTEHSGTGILDGSASALFADFQNRGMQDLLVVRTGGPLLFANMGRGRFEPRPDAFRFARQPQGTFTSVAAADYNRDGFLDVYLCVYSYYQGLNQYQYPSPYYDAQNGPPNFLFRNRGDGTFEDVTVQSGLDQNNNRYSFAVAWCDYDNNGWPDLYVANDFGRKNLYRSNGDGTFKDVAKDAGVEDYGPGMSTCWLDHDNDGFQDVYVANMWLPEGRRITADDHFLPGVDPGIRALYQKHNAGNSFYRNTGTGAFENKTSEAGTAMGRWSWSCASWDFDNDGWADLYVANGFVSGPNSKDLQSFFWRQVAQRSVTPAGASPEYDLAWNAVNELVRSDFSWSGYQRNVFFLNNHDGTFSDVSGVLGLDLRDDCRAYALSDFDHDGRMEFVIKNRTGPQLRVLRNDLDGIGNSIVFRLTGRKSNRDAIGATVTIAAGATRQTKFVSAGSGFASQHTKELFFGLAEAPGPISISVRWPTGVVDRYSGLAVNQRVEIIEGEQNFKAAPYQPPQRRQAAAASPPVGSTPDNTWLVAPLWGPDLQLADHKGKTQRLSALRGRPVLLTFVRPDCGDSRKQLDQFHQSSGALANAGLSLYVVAMSSDPAAIEDLTHSANLRFPVYIGDERTTGAWNIQYRYLFDRRRDMPLPMSFLLDASGAVVRIYQGVVATQSVIHDWNMAPATPEERFARAMPFPGPYFGAPMKHDYLTYGIAFAEYEYIDEALGAFHRAIDANPAQVSAWFNLGTIYLSKKMYLEARKYMSEAARLNPHDADAWNNLGMISGEEEKYDEALDEFRHAALLDPNHELAVENMMRIYRFQGRAADAQKALEELIAEAPRNAGLHLALAMSLVAQNDLQRARDELETSIRLKPDSPDAINNLGAVLLRMGQTGEALKQFEEARRLAPDFDRAAINAALVYNSTGQAAKAREVLTDFLAQHPGNAEVRSALGKMGPP